MVILWLIIILNNVTLSKEVVTQYLLENWMFVFQHLLL